MRQPSYTERKQIHHRGVEMAEIERKEHLGQDQVHHRYYSPTVLPLIQSLLATLADMEFAFEQECERVRNTTDVRLRARILKGLRAKHQARRDTYVRELALLQKQAFIGGPHEGVAA
jgi:hypothetical protein